MTKIPINNCYNIKFLNSLINLILKQIKGELLKNKNLLDYIINNYNITLDQIINTFKKNIIINKTDKNIAIYLNENAYIADNIKLSQLVALIDYGNREVKGLNIINKIFKDVKKHIFVYYLEYRLSKGSQLWQ